MNKAMQFGLAGVVFAVAGAIGLHLTRPAPAPGIEYTLLDGSRHHSDELRGKVVLVNFWATSCVSCIREMPRLAATQRQYGARGFETLAVAMPYDPPAYVISYAESRQLPFGVVIDNTGEVVRRYGSVQVTPTSFLLDRQGRIVRRWVGEPDFQQLHRLLDELLAQT
jgi:peroxiredoxin